MRTNFEDYVDDEGRFMGVALENDYFEDKISEATYDKFINRARSLGMVIDYTTTY